MTPSSAEDLRSVERLTYRCESGLGRRDITLFGNGTLRLRERVDNEDQMNLVELTPEELNQWLDHLLTEDPTDNALDRRRIMTGVGGDWVESCEMRLTLPGRGPVVYSFGRYDTQSLELGRLIAIAERLAIRVAPTYRSDLPRDYMPSYGDVLIDRQGQRWRALWVTEDRRGVELQGLQQPIRRIVAIEALPAEYVAIEADPSP